MPKNGKSDNQAPVAPTPNGAAQFRGPDPFGEYEPAYRSLRVYAFHPGLGRRSGNHLILRVPFEPLKPGPIGSRVRVIDESLEGEPLHPPVDLEHPDIIRNGGIEPLSLIHISEPTRLLSISYAVFCLKKKKKS